MRVTKVVEFETAHLLPGYDGGCGNLHGHSYKIEVTVEGPKDQNNFGMVMDFKDLKKAINTIVPDHRFVFGEGDEISQKIANILDEYNLKYIKYPFLTTAENMVGYFAELINEYIHNELGIYHAHVVQVKLWETSTSFAEWNMEPRSDI